MIINYRQTFKLKPNKYSVKKNICSESHCAKACNIQIQMDINNTSTQTLFTFLLDKKMKTFIPSNNSKLITIWEWITTKINRKKLKRIIWNRRFEKKECWKRLIGMHFHCLAFINTYVEISFTIYNDEILSISCNRISKYISNSILARKSFQL